MANFKYSCYIYLLVPLADKRYEIYYSSMEQKGLLYLKSVWFFHAHLQLF